MVARRPQAPCGFATDLVELNCLNVRLRLAPLRPRVAVKQHIVADKELRWERGKRDEVQ